MNAFAVSVASQLRVEHRLLKATGPDRLADRGDDVACAILLELLGRRALQVHVVGLAGAKRRGHLLGPAGVHRTQRAIVDALTVQGEPEHGERLAAVVDQHPRARQLVPAEGRIRLARRSKGSRPAG